MTDFAVVATKVFLIDLIRNIAIARNGFKPSDTTISRDVLIDEVIDVNENITIIFYQMAGCLDPTKVVVGIDATDKLRFALDANDRDIVRC